MKCDLISDILIEEKAGTSCTVGGWVKTARRIKDLLFLEINDGSIFDNLQIVLERSHPQFDEICNVRTGASLVAWGTLAASPARGQVVELHPEAVRIFGNTDTTYPLQKKRHSFEFLRSQAHLRGRTNTIGAVMRVRSRLAQAVHRFFCRDGFQYIHTPIITASDCEGAGEMFQVTTLGDDHARKSYEDDFFKKRTYLTVSGQLEGEAYACSMGRIYTFGPTFRAENSHTARHLAEFWMVEPEAAFYEIDDVMDLAERFLRELVSTALSECRRDLDFFSLRIEPGLTEELEEVLKTPVPRCTYSDAIDLLAQADSAFDHTPQWGEDLQTEHERYLSEEYFRGPLIVYNYPAAIKPFYMKQNDDGKTVGAMDLLVPRIGELMGGSEREYRPDRLEKALAEEGLSVQDYSWYLDLRRYGTVPHGGFGLGFERLIQYITGMKNIRDVIPFPRYPGNADF
ncbi:MAG: asparagine--tRNA ligase [Fibrobacterota bacterium]